MPFHSDKQRKGFFGSRGNPRSNVEPKFVKGQSKFFQFEKNTKPKLTKQVSGFVAKKIRKNIKEGKPLKQSIAIAFSQARKRFPKQKKSLEKIVSNPNGKLTTKKIINLLVFLFGVSVALSILRRARK